MIARGRAARRDFSGGAAIAIQFVLFVCSEVMTLPTKVTDTNRTDLDQLVADRVTEGAHLDFKRQLPTTWDNEAKKRFIADLVAFANAGGGDLVFGVDEDSSAAASAVVPQVFASVDAEVRRLQDFVLELAEPRLPGVQVHPVAATVGAVSGHCIVIRVPQSWAGPHRSKVNWHFYVRDGLRNRQLDIPEVKALFLRSDSQAQRMRDFRSERLAKISTGQTPVALPVAPKLVVHVIPTQAALGQAHIDPTRYTRGRQALPVIGTLPASPVSLNLDGAFAPIVANGAPPGYTQHFRQGYFEAVWKLTPFGDVPKPVLPGIAYESYVNQFIGSVRGQLSQLDINQDVAVFLSLLDADQAVLTGPHDLGIPGAYSTKAFDRKDVLLPDVLIEASSSVGRGMRPAYDLMCQAAGFEGSPNYDQTGEWKGK